MSDEVEPKESYDRRAFLRRCGRFAAVTTPAVAFLVTTKMTTPALAASGGGGSTSSGGGGHGWVVNLIDKIF